MRRHIDAGIEVELDDDIDPASLEQGAEPRKPGEVDVDAIEAAVLAETGQDS